MRLIEVAVTKRRVKVAIYQHNGRKIYYEIHGEGRPMIVLNGIMMSTASWKMFVPALSAGNQLILMDFFDQGQSEKLTDVKYDHSLQVEALKGLLEHLGHEKINMIGVSYGGNTALKFAAEHPEMVERLIIFHAAPDTGSWLRAVGKSWAMSIDDPENFYNTAIPVIYSPEFYNNNPEWIAERKQLLTTQTFKDMDFMNAIVRLSESAEKYDIRDKLCQITARTMIVSAEYDLLTPPSEQKALKDGIKDAELVHLPGCGHASMYEKPTLFLSFVLGFVNSDFTGL